MSGIYGPSGSGSSPSASLQSSLESKLRAGLAGSGSPLFALTWKRWDILSGPPICALRASARRTSDSDCSSWLTPCTQDGLHGGLGQGTDRLPGAAALAPWSTPRANKWGFPDAHGSKEAPLASWATPSASGFEARDVNRMMERREECRQRTGNGNGFGLTLGQQVATLGPTSNGSPASTESGGQLNPAFSLWLMGFPPEWLSFAPSETRSFHKSRRGSSLLHERVSIALSEIIGDEE